jgi:hypothetical protein
MVEEMCRGKQNPMRNSRLQIQSLNRPAYLVAFPNCPLFKQIAGHVSIQSQLPPPRPLAVAALAQDWLF